MPRKQKQRQSQKQTVIVNIREPSKKKRSVRRRKSASRDGVSSMQTALPPPVIYQSTYSIPYPVQAPPPIQAPVRERGFLTDVGQVGTEGRVEILDQPTKKEQQSEMITPVPSQIAGFADLEGLRKRVQTAFVQTQTDRTSTAESGMQTDRMQLPPRPKGPPPVNYVAKMVSEIAQKEAEYKQKMTGVPIETNVEQVVVKGFTDSGMTEKQKPIADQIPVDREALTPQAQYIPPPVEKKNKANEAPQKTPEYGAAPAAAAAEEAPVKQKKKYARKPTERVAGRRVKVDTNPLHASSTPYWLLEYKKLTGNDYELPAGDKKPNRDKVKAAVELLLTTTKA